MINYMLKGASYFKEEKMFQNRWKTFQNEQNMFSIVNDQERVPEVMKCVLDRSTFEHPPLLLEHFLFLKQGALIFWNAFLDVFVENVSLGLQKSC